MGQDINLLILHPNEFDFKTQRYLFCNDLRGESSPRPDLTCTLWRIEQILNLGYVSAPVNNEGFSEREPRMRAALHFMDCFFGALQKQIHEDKEKCFAPPFTILKSSNSGEESTERNWESQFIKQEIKGESFISPIGNYTVYDQIPTQEIMEKHNGISKEKPLNILQQYYGYPLVWFPCRQVLGWVKERRKDSYWSKLIEGDIEALAYVNLWSAALEAMSPTRAMCLFLFEDVRIRAVL